MVRCFGSDPLDASTGAAKMTDIVDRLRAEGADAMHKHLSLGMHGLCADAANEIERLRRFVEFVSLWTHREAPFQAEECLHMIKFHPVLQVKEAA